MEEEALNDAYGLFVNTGYKGSIDDYKTLIQSNPEALKDSHSLFVGTGYKGDLDKFQSLIGLKKKEVSDGTQENQNLDSEANVQATSLATSNIKIKGDERNVRATDNTATKLPKAIKPNLEDISNYQAPDLSEKDKILAEQRKQAFKEAKEGFKNAITFTDQDKQEIEQRVKDEETISTWDKIKRGAINTVKTLAGVPDSIIKTKTPFEDEIKEVKQQAIKSKEKLTDEEAYLKAKELYKQKQEDYLFVDKGNRFLDDLPVETKSALKLETSAVADNLSQENKARVKINDALKISLDESLADLQEMEQNYSNRTDITQEDIDAFNQKRQEAANTYARISNNYDELIKNESDLQSAEKEYDLLKRTYSNVFTSNIALTTLDLAVGLVDFGNYMNEINPISPLPSIDTKEIRDDLKEERELIRKPIDNVESVDGFFNYLSDLVANQLPVLAVTSTGYGGLATLGASTSGQKYAEMSDEVLDGTATYSPFQMMSVPILYGGAEAVSEIPTLAILNKGRRVISAAQRAGTPLFEKSAKDIAKEWAKDYAGDMTKEMAGEQFTNLAQNALNIYALGKEGSLLDNAEDVFKDTFTLTTLLKVSPHIVGQGLKVFQKTDDFKKLELNAQQLKLLSEELGNPDITDTEKTVISKKIEELTSVSSQIMAKTIKDVGDMPKPLYDELIRLNGEAGELRKQAKDIYVNGKSKDKDALIKGIEDQYSAIQEQRTAIIEGNRTVVDILPLKEQDRLKREALTQLTQELNPEGTKNITIDDQQITERANEIYEQESKATEEATKPEVEDGTPESKKIKVFRGTDIDLKDFNFDKVEPGLFGQGMYVTTDRNRANTYKSESDNRALDKGKEQNAKIFEFEIDIKNPISIKSDEYALLDKNFPDRKELTKELQKKGYDSIEIDMADGTMNYVIFDAKNIVTNENLPTTDTAIDGNIQPTVEPSEQQGESDNVQPAVEPGASEGTVEVKTYSVSDSKNSPIYTVTKNKDVLEVKDADGKVPSKTTERKILEKYSDDIDFTQGELAVVPEQEGVNPTEIVAKDSNNPAEVAVLLNTINTADYIENQIDYKTKVIADNLGNVEKQSYVDNGDKNNIGNNMARSYFSKKGEGRSLDVIAMELSEDYGIDIAEKDLVEHMERYTGGKNDVYKEVRDTQIKPLQQRFTELTGLPANDKYITKAVKQAIKKEQLNDKIDNDYLNVLPDQELVSLSQEAIDYERFRQQNPETDTSDAGGIEANNTTGSQEQSSVRERTDATDGEQASQARVKTLTNERIKPSKQKPNNPPKKLNAIIAKVGNDLKATMVYGKSRRRNSAGTYNPSNALVKIRNAGDLDTVAHELGHLLDDRHDILGPVRGHKNEVALIGQIKWFSDRGGSNPPAGLSKARKTSYLEREGLAEFIRGYVVNPKETKAVAPELYSYFETAIDEKTKDVLKEFSDNVIDFENATYGEQILSNIDDNILPNKKGFKEWLQQFKGEDGKLNITFFDKFKANWTNSMALPNKAFKFIHEIKGTDVAALKPEENFEVMSRLFAGINGKFNYIFSKGMVDGKGKLIKDSTGKNINIKYLLEVLDNSSEKALTAEMNDAITLMVAERTVEYIKKLGRTDGLTGIGGGLKTDLEVAVGHLEEVEDLKATNPEKYDRINEGARRYREFADAGLKYAVDKGRITPEQYKTIKASNEYYVSLARTKELVPGEELLPFLGDSNKITSVKEVIKKAKGGTDMIKNPYLSLIQNTVNFIKESDRNEVMLSFINPLNEVRDMGDGPVKDLSQIARLVSAGEKNTIKVYKDGELQHWQFDQDIYDGLKGLEGISHNELIKYMGKPADLIRFTVTNFPVFAMRNAFRDTMSRLVISRTRGKVSDLLHNKDDRAMYELYGGSQAGFYLMNADAHREALSTAVKDMTKKGNIVLDPRKLNYTNYRKILERGENLNRIAEYKSAYRKAIKEGMDEYNAGLYAAYQARDLMDFAVAGHYMRVINKLVPFSNASVQSVKRSVKGAKENPAKFAMRMALFTVLPQLAFRMLVIDSGDEEEYEELPDYQRDLFWNFKTPLTGDKWVALPKPFELGLPSSLIDRGISKARGNEKAFDGAVASSIKTLFPFDETALVGSLKPIIEVSSNHDFFRDKDIVPFWEKDKLMDLREGSKYASRIGQTLSDGFGLVGAEVDPRNIDHVIKGYTTYFGDITLTLGDIGKEDSRNQLNFTKTGFMKEAPIGTAKSVKRVMDIAEEIGAESDKNLKTLKGMVKLYYDLEDDDAKTKLRKAIYDYSKSLEPYFEGKKKIKLLTVAE